MADAPTDSWAMPMDPQVVARFADCGVSLLNDPNEVFAAAFLDSRHRLIEYAELFQGTIDGAEVHPREVVRHAIRTNCAAIIIGHNHPSGSVEPSAADRAVTAQLKQVLSLVDVRLLDHIVVGGHQTTALAERGWV